MCQMCNTLDITRFVTAGNARFTLVSERTGQRFTYRVSKPKDARPGSEFRFVSLLTGPDNENSYTYLGVLNGSEFKLTSKSRATEGAPSVVAFRYLCTRVLQNPDAPLPPGLAFYHEGKCGKCNRPLTVPESINRGIGPECWQKMAA